ncbi:MAG: TIGR00296 family protein [Thermoproteota archaeon]|nr:MAG: TIGR00296 family protein [Candidatus Korarchaeota archaeon]
MALLSNEEGEYLVRLARRSIEYWFEKGEYFEDKQAPSKLKEKRGVFVTLNRYPSMELRGCIGFPYPVYPLVDAVARAAIAAAFEDPRFPPLSRGELSEVVVEVSALTFPERIFASSAEEYAERVVVGRDGIIVSYHGRSGLLLPQVAVEQGWDSMEFLRHCCFKAFLPASVLDDPDVEVYKFQAEVFAEERPGGAVRRVELTTRMHR